MAEYILRNRDKLSELLQKAGLSTLSEITNSSNTEELKNEIKSQPNAEFHFHQLSKFFILKHIFDYSNKTIDSYDTAIQEKLTGLLGSNPAHESIAVQKSSGLKFPFKIWTKRTGIIQFSVIGIWLMFLIYLHFKYPNLWIFTFHLPISGIFALMLPALVLTLISPRFFGQEKFDNINTLGELVDETYNLNLEKIRSNNYSYLSEEIKNYINEKSP